MLGFGGRRQAPIFVNGNTKIDGFREETLVRSGLSGRANFGRLLARIAGRVLLYT